VARTRVLVVDDSEVARRLLIGILNADPGLEVVGEAATGEEAYAKATRLKPDVITMDLHMPAMNGFQTTRKIMEDSPRPIVIVSSDHNASEVARSFEALEAGALTVLRKPELNADGNGVQLRELTETVKLMAGVKVFRRRKGRRRRVPEPAPLARFDEIEIVAIGSSTGGPAALRTILETLPSTLPVPVDGLRPLPGDVLIAPHGLHLGVTKDRRVRLSEARPIGGHRPAATYLFDSVARIYGPSALGVILTGMGEDGTAGLHALKAAGGRVLGQDEATCVVYGMPRAALQAGLVDESLPVSEIGIRIIEAFRLD
jgi:two-component system chemotaxis response regulator CheB